MIYSQLVSVSVIFLPEHRSTHIMKMKSKYHEQNVKTTKLHQSLCEHCIL